VKKLKVLDLFSGIGGFSLGLERAGGFEAVAFCEIEPFPQKVLRKHWPMVPIYNDVRTVNGKEVAQEIHGNIDVITGGFP
jgi:DNA (cytosine-5)-methyltransferase 1